MGWPQLIILLIFFSSLGMVYAKHGEAKTDTYNGWYSTVSVTIILALLWAGGFFS